jgi:hypothetical protein
MPPALWSAERFGDADARWWPYASGAAPDSGLYAAAGGPPPGPPRRDQVAAARALLHSALCTRLAAW